MIQLSHIEKTYQGAAGPVYALKGVDLHIKRGEIYGVIGLSGAGKSTLVRCINMLERPTKGKVVVDGQDLTMMNEDQLRRARKNIGMIFQHFNLLASATVYENVAFPLKLAGMKKAQIREKVLPLLDLVGLSDKKGQYPSQLSGGQKQRVGIARALASDPKVLLCDEATSALDPQTTKSILELIRDINQKLQLTVVLITHEMQVIKEICDYVAVIENGVICEQGTVLDVFTNPQQAITRDFISAIISHEIPEALKGEEILPGPQPGSNLLARLSFIGTSADEPVISGMVRRYQVDTNILYGNVDHIQNTPYGTLVLEIAGTDEDIQKALGYLNERNLGIEVIGYVRRSNG